ncbi:MAG: hypothetical protein EZS28_000238 [Streblomastix strix]|uniref:Uncharacterized protein n=1 Tax=Streblomastix strix TaxID=222440 RepID=A0A5J4XAC3_9EUKA|nr:MAG: hypothetical protein EZS28_000238 [Streblomastix strix]
MKIEIVVVTEQKKKMIMIKKCSIKYWNCLCDKIEDEDEEEGERRQYDGLRCFIDDVEDQFSPACNEMSLSNESCYSLDNDLLITFLILIPMIII